MKVESQKAFDRDVEKIRNKKLAVSLKEIIDQLKSCKSQSEIRNLKKMHGPGNYYRIRIGEYRLGIKIQSETIYLLRFMDRKEIYRYFP